jgi:carbonic anhydrase
MEKVFNFISSKDEYVADACIITCFDNRIYKVRKAFAKKLGLKHPDVVELAGGIKVITQGNEEKRELALDQIRTSKALHHADRVILMPHRDCGAYGGSEKFGDQQAEYAFQANEMEKATAIIKKAFPAMNVESYLLDFDGVHRA